MKSHSYLMIAILFAILFLGTRAYADDPFEVGKAALKKGDLQTAIPALTEAVNNEKKDPERYYWLGSALLQADSIDRAVTVLVQGRELNQSDVKMYVLLGDAYSRQKIYGAAIPEYQKAIALDSLDPKTYIKLGKAFMKMRQYTDGARTLMLALALDTSSLFVNRELADLYMRANPKQYANAIPLLERLEKIAPDSINFRVHLTHAYFHTGNFAKLMPVAQSVLQQDSNQAEVSRELGLSYLLSRDNENAVKILRGLDQKNLLKAEDLIELGKAQRALDQTDDAIASYEKAFRADSTDGDVYYDLGTLYMKRKQYPEAVGMFEKKIATDSTAAYQFASYLNAAMCLMQDKGLEKAKQYILKALEFKPGNVQAWLLLAEVYGLTNQIPDELTSYKKVIALVADDTTSGAEGKYDRALAEAYRNIGINMLIEATKDKDPETNKKKYAGAAEFIKKALQYDPKDCDVLYYAGVASQNSNNKEDAKRFYRRFLETCPHDKRVEEVKKHLESLGD